MVSPCQFLCFSFLLTLFQSSSMGGPPSGQSLMNCSSVDPPLDGVVLQEQTAPVLVHHRLQILPEDLLLYRLSLGYSFLQLPGVVSADRLWRDYLLQDASLWNAGGHPVHMV